MELFGVNHDEAYADAIIAYALDTWPQARRVMLELPPQYTADDFGPLFPRLEELLTARGAEVIRGDTAFVLPPQRMNDDVKMMAAMADHLHEHKRLPPKFFRTFGRAAKDMAAQMYQNVISSRRDKAMCALVAERHPDLVVVGRLHADYLKHRFPDARYTAMVFGDEEFATMPERIKFALLGQRLMPYRADVLVDTLGMYRGYAAKND